MATSRKSIRLAFLAEAYSQLELPNTLYSSSHTHEDTFGFMESYSAEEFFTASEIKNINANLDRLANV